MTDIESLAPPGSSCLIRGVLFRDPNPPSGLVDLMESIPDVWYMKPSATTAASGVVRHDIYDARNTSDAQAGTSKLQGVALTISDQVLQNDFGMVELIIMLTIWTTNFEWKSY